MSRIIVIFLAAMVATALTAPIDGRLAGLMSEVKGQATVKAQCAKHMESCWDGSKSSSKIDCCDNLVCVSGNATWS